MRCHPVFHVGLLLEYKADGREQPNPAPLEFDDGEEGEWFEIDRVLSHRWVTLRGERVAQYLVKWKGYGDEYNQWRDEVGVTDAATEEYWQRVGGRGAPPPHARKKRKASRKGGQTGRRGRHKAAGTAPH